MPKAAKKKHPPKNRLRDHQTVTPGRAETAILPALGSAAGTGRPAQPNTPELGRGSAGQKFKGRARITSAAMMSRTRLPISLGAGVSHGLEGGTALGCIIPRRAS